MRCFYTRQNKRSRVAVASLTELQTHLIMLHLIITKCQTYITVRTFKKKFFRHETLKTKLIACCTNKTHTAHHRM